MDGLDQRIAGRLETVFAAQGFAEPGVAVLRAAADVSLRTLYRYYPSREAMIIGALDHRHDRYLAQLGAGAPPPGAASLDHLFGRLGDWMRRNAPGGCLFLNALAAHPENADIRAAVDRHKREILRTLGARAGRPALGPALFLIHEGTTASWAVLGDRAIESARRMARALIEGDDA